MKFERGTGCDESPFDLRTFSYVPTGAPVKGGSRYNPEDIEDQHKVGICTAISLTQQARKATGIKYSADFQYLNQKILTGNWDEGSSIFTSLKVAKNIGLLPESEWTHTTEDDRKLSYAKYIKKLQAIPQAEIDRLKQIASAYKITAYTKVPVDRDIMAQAITDSAAGLLTRYAIGNEWYRKPIEPLRQPAKPISGHAITESNFDGDSFRVANSWGTDWADKGTAYRLDKDYQPTEAWLVHYGTPPKEVQKQLDARTTKLAATVDLLQKVLELYKQLFKIK